MRAGDGGDAVDMLFQKCGQDLDKLEKGLVDMLKVGLLLVSGAHA